MKSGRCTKCDAETVGHLSGLFEQGRSGLVPTHVGVVPDVVLGFIANHKMFGAIEAYVCTSCGYLEHYVADPGSVPWTELAGFTPVAPSAKKKPYR